MLGSSSTACRYRYLAAAGERLDIKIDDRGSGRSARTSGAPELELPALTEPAAFEALADRRTYEPTLAPPIVVTGLLGVLLDLEGRQELAPVGTLADCSKVLSGCFAPAR